MAYWMLGNANEVYEKADRRRPTWAFRRRPTRDFRTLVPVQLDFGKGNVTMIGTIGLTGEATVPIDVKLKLPKAPKRVVVNANGEVLARE